MRVSSFLPRNFVGIWKRWELGLCVERGYKIHYMISPQFSIFFNFQVRYLRQNSRKADKVRKNCLIVFNLSFYTYLSNQSLKSADFLWQSFFSLFFEVSFVLWGEQDQPRGTRGSHWLAGGWLSLVQVWICWCLINFAWFSAISFLGTLKRSSNRRFRGEQCL